MQDTLITRYHSNRMVSEGNEQPTEHTLKCSRKEIYSRSLEVVHRKLQLFGRRCRMNDNQEIKLLVLVCAEITK